MALRLKWWTVSVIVVVLAFVNVMDGMKRLLSKKKSSKETGPCDIYSFKRGQFERLQEPTESPESLNQLVDPAAIVKEIKCNDWYYMLSYLHLTNPQYFGYPGQVEKLHCDINDKYPGWARKMLATAFNVAQNDTDTDVPWLMFLYSKRIEVHVHEDKDPFNAFLPVMMAAHYGLYKVLLCTMSENDCTMMPETKRERKFTAYVADMQRTKPTYTNFLGNSNAVLKLLGKHWDDLRHNSSLAGCCQNEVGTSSGPAPDGVRSLTEENFTLDLLYLNDVFENVQSTTLLTDFGVFEDGKRSVDYLRDIVTKMKSCSRPMSFPEYVSSLADFHEHAQLAFKTMMLRIYYDFLEKLKTLNKDLRQERVEQFLRPYSDWCDFLHLPKEDNGFYVSELHQTWDSDNCISEGTLPTLQDKVIATLRKNEMLARIPMSHHTAESLRRINIEEFWIMTIAKEYQIPFSPELKASEHRLNEPIQTTILCAEVLIGYMKYIFNNINFKAVQSLVKLRTSTNFERFVEYGPRYREDYLY